jgi:hypothetical protein
MLIARLVEMRTMDSGVLLKMKGHCSTWIAFVKARHIE